MHQSDISESFTKTVYIEYIMKKMLQKHFIWKNETDVLFEKKSYNLDQYVNEDSDLRLANKQLYE